jgi:hypothetical protein
MRCAPIIDYYCYASSNVTGRGYLPSTSGKLYSSAHTADAVRHNIHKPHRAKRTRISHIS